MRTLPLPTRPVLALAAILLFHPFLFSQDASSYYSTQSTVQPNEGPLQIASVMRESKLPETWSASRAEADPLPAAPVIAVEPIQIPKPECHPFLDRQNRVLFIAVGSVAAADFWVTHSNLASGGRELDPVARVFCGSTAGLATNFALETGSVIGISYLFHKTGHHKMERLTSYVNLVGSGGSFLYSFTHR